MDEDALIRNSLLRSLILPLCLIGLGCGDPVAGRSGGSEGRTEKERVVWRGRLLSAPIDRPQFTLRDTQGESYDFHERTSGRVTLLFFGYTSCPDVCPAHFGQIASAMKTLDSAFGDARKQIDVVFVGVDAPRDTPEKVQQWLSHFDASFVGLVGEAEALAAAQKAAAVPTAQRDPGGTEEAYTVSHASFVMLYTPDDQAHLRYAFDTDAEDWVHDLGSLLRGRRPS